MRKFILKINIFITPVILWFMVEAFLPVTTFTFRHYEALHFDSNIPKQNSWYPNIESNMSEVGDLCHHTKYSVLKKIYWKTDRYGFRNDKVIYSPDVLLIGDSFVQGSGLSQEQTITNKLISKTKNKIKIYNMAPSSMSDFIYYLNTGNISKPKILIFEIVERNIPENIKYYKNTKISKIKELIRKVLGLNNLNVYIDKALKNYSLKWLKARIEGEKGRGVQSPIDSNMFFYKGLNQKNKIELVNKTFNVVKSYKAFCDSLNIKFIFLPMPNKETVYFDYVPLQKQSKYLFKLESLLKDSNIQTINTLKIYNDYRKVNKELLYHSDDSHWNPIATELISNEILKVIKKE